MGAVKITVKNLLMALGVEGTNWTSGKGNEKLSKLNEFSAEKHKSKREMSEAKKISSRWLLRFIKIYRYVLTTKY